MLRVTAYFIFVISLLITACKKDSNKPVSIVGTWELRITYYGFGGQKEYPAGNGNLITYSETTYKRYVDNAPTDSGTYKLVKEKSNTTGKKENRIIYNNQEDATHNYFTLSKDTLSFYTSILDAGSSLYIKK